MERNFGRIVISQMEVDVVFRFWFLYRAYHDWDHLYPGLPAKLDKELEAEGWDPETSED